MVIPDSDISRVVYPNTPPQAEQGMSDSALRYFSGALKPSWGKNSLSKKSRNQGKLPVYYSVAPSPISRLCLWCFGLGSGFVNISAVCSGSRQPCTSRILSLTKS